MTSFVDIDNVTVKNSTINGGNWVGGIAGGSYGCITNCKVESSKITASPYLVAENEYDNGDKAGGIVGYQCASTTNIKISGCTVDASIITGYRDIGGIAGTLSWSEAEKTAPSCTGNTVKDTSIIQSLTNAYGKDISSLNIGGIYGRIVENTSVKVTLSNNTIKDKDDKVLTSAAISGDYYHNLEDNTYYIGSKAGLYAFAAAVNAGGNSSTTSGVTTYYHYSGKTFNLVADIDLNNEAWTPIGTEDNPFKGTFDGNNHTISNLYINDSTKSYIGLFGVMNDSNAKIQNVKVKNVNLMGEECVGSIIGSSYVGSLYNCHVSGKIILSGNYKVGGITGSGYAPIDTCTVDGGNSSESSITGIYNGDLNNREGDNIGGIIGYFAEHNNHTSINNCSVSNISIQGTRKVGGIAGYLESNDMVTGATVSNVTISTTAKTTKISEDKTYYDDNKLQQ
jgi:hypothetical protein